MQTPRERALMLGAIVLAAVALVAAGVLGWYVYGLQERVIALESARQGADQRVELAEKALQSVAAGQVELQSRVEQQMMSLEGLEKRVRSLEERLEAMEQAIRDHSHQAPQLG